MNENEHRLGVTEGSLVERHLKIVSTEVSEITQAVIEIDELYGIEYVSLHARSGVLDVAYDARRVCIDCIEDILNKYSIELSHDVWTNFKEGYYRFVDQNIKDNASHEPWSCHKSPPHARRR